MICSWFYFYRLLFEFEVIELIILVKLLFLQQSAPSSAQRYLYLLL